MQASLLSNLSNRWVITQERFFMKFVNISFNAPRDEVLSILRDNERVNNKIRFDESRGKPFIKVKEKKGDRIRITCEYIGGPSKDNEFFVGTYFSGRLTEKNGVTRLRGHILTAPIYHLFMILLVVVFIIQCFKLKGFSVVPPILVIFDFFMFKSEFQKQGYIKRYLMRAARRIDEGKLN